MSPRLPQKLLPLFLSVLLSGLLGEPLLAQEWHPEVKKTWDGYTEWPLLEPGALPSGAGRRLAGLDAAYERVDGLGSPDEATQIVRFRFERAGYKGRPALLTTWTAAGDPRSAKSSPQVMTSITDLDTLALLESFDGSGDHTVVEKSGIRARVQVEEGKHEEKQLEGEHAVFDVGLMRALLASMTKLEAGKGFRLAVYNPFTNATMGTANLIAGKVKIEDAHGRRHEVWDVQNLWSREGAVGHYYVKADPPYFFGFEAGNLVTGEVSTRVRYLEHSRFD